MFRQVGSVCEHTPSEVHDGRVGVVEFDEIHARRIREHFINDDTRLRIDGHRFRRAWRASDQRTRGPSEGGCHAEAWTCEHQRWPAAVGRSRPRMLAVVVDFKCDAVAFIAQPQRAAVVCKLAGKRPEHARDSIRCLHIRRFRRDHETPERGKRRAVGKFKTHIAADSVSGEIFRPGLRVVEFDKLHVEPVGAHGRVIHDFGENERSASGSWSDWLGFFQSEIHRVHRR